MTPDTKARWEVAEARVRDAEQKLAAAERDRTRYAETAECNLQRALRAEARVRDLETKNAGLCQALEASVATAEDELHSISLALAAIGCHNENAGKLAAAEARVRELEAEVARLTSERDEARRAWELEVRTHQESGSRWLKRAQAFETEVARLTEALAAAELVSTAHRRAWDGADLRAKAAEQKLAAAEDGAKAHYEARQVAEQQWEAAQADLADADGHLKAMHDQLDAAEARVRELDSALTASVEHTNASESELAQLRAAVKRAGVELEVRFALEVIRGQ